LYLITGEPIRRWPGSGPDPQIEASG